MAVPLWLTGHHITLMEANVQVLNTSTGGLTDSGAGNNYATLADNSAIGLVDSIEFSASRTTENISSATELASNAVSIGRNGSITVTEILRTATNGSLLARIWTSTVSRYVRVKFTRGAQFWQFYGIATGYTESIRRGKSVSTMSFRLIDIGSNNPALT